MIMRYHLDKSPGRWRTGPIYVHNEVTDQTVYEGPDADDVPSLMEGFVASLDTTSGDVLVRAAMAHLNLVMIHPFRDGNGRISRALQSLVIAREGILAPMFCSIEEYLGDNTQAYYDVLAEVGQGYWNPHRDARPWVRFSLVAHYRQAYRLLGRIKTYERVWIYLEQRTRRLGLPERAVSPLLHAAAGARLRRGLYAEMAEVSDDTASRDLKACVDAGVLVAHGEKRGRFYTAAVDLRTEWQAAKVSLVDADADPFAQLRLPTGP